MSAEDEIRRAVAVLDSQRSQLESLVQQQELLQLSLEEHLRAKETVSRFRQAGKGAEILVPVGAGTFVTAEIKEEGKALINVGSDLVIEEEVDKVVERMDERIRQMEEAGKSVGERLAALDDKVKVQTKFVQDLYEKMDKEASGFQGGQ